MESSAAFSSLLEDLELLLEVLDRLLHGPEVGEHAAEPAVVHVELARALRLALRRAPAPAAWCRRTAPCRRCGDRLAQEVERRPEARAAVWSRSRMWTPLRSPKMKPLHARVPAPGLVPEVGAGLEQAAHAELARQRGDDGGLVSGSGGRGRRAACRASPVLRPWDLLRGCASAPAVAPRPGRRAARRRRCARAPQGRSGTCEVGGDLADGPPVATHRAVRTTGSAPPSQVVYSALIRT